MRVCVAKGMKRLSPPCFQALRYCLSSCSSRSGRRGNESGRSDEERTETDIRGKTRKEAAETENDDEKEEKGATGLVEVSVKPEESAEELSSSPSSSESVCFKDRGFPLHSNNTRMFSF